MNTAVPSSSIQPSDGVIRKPLDADCLLDGELHPSVADRLAHVRDLPVAAVASLRAVERDVDGVHLVWQFIEGITLKQYLSSNPDAAEIDRVRRELRFVVEAMHAHGIVHGAIHARNVIVDPQKKVRLTHVSPLLYSDPQQDLDAIEEMFAEHGVASRTHILADASEQAEDRKLRRRAYLAAMLAAVVGILMFLGILWYIRS